MQQCRPPAPCNKETCFENLKPINTTPLQKSPISVTFLSTATQVL